MRRTLTFLTLVLGLSLATPAWISSASAAQKKAGKKDSSSAKKDSSASKKNEKKNDRGFEL